MMAGEWASLGIQQAGGAANFVKRKLSAVAAAAAAAGDDHVIIQKNPRILKRIQQAQRMSAVAKLMSKTLLKGAISVSTHVATGLADLNHVHDDAPASVSGAQLGHQTSSAAAGLVESAAFPGAAKPSVAVASVDAFGKVVEAVETAGKSLYAATKAVGTNLVQQRFGTDAGRQMVQDSFGVVGNAIDTAWTLNKLGLRMLLQATAASTILCTTSTGTAAAGSSKTKKPYIPTINNLQQQQQQQPPAASSMHLFPSKSEHQQLEAGSDAEHQTLLQSAASHQQEQEASSAKNLAAAGSGRANLFTDAENDVSSLPRTHIFLGPAIQHPNAVSSFTPAAAADSSYIPHQPKNACDASADSYYIPHQPKNACDASADSYYIPHQPKNAFEQFNLFQNYDLGVQARSESPSIFNFPFSLNRKE
jgi:hypothetical protein